MTSCNIYDTMDFTVENTSLVTEVIDLTQDDAVDLTGDDTVDVRVIPHSWAHFFYMIMRMGWHDCAGRYVFPCPSDSLYENMLRINWDDAFDNICLECANTKMSLCPFRPAVDSLYDYIFVCCICNCTVIPEYMALVDLIASDDIEIDRINERQESIDSDYE